MHPIRQSAELYRGRVVARMKYQRENFAGDAQLLRSARLLARIGAQYNDIYRCPRRAP